MGHEDWSGKRAQGSASSNVISRMDAFPLSPGAFSFKHEKIFTALLGLELDRNMLLGIVLIVLRVIDIYFASFPL